MKRLNVYHPLRQIEIVAVEELEREREAQEQAIRNFRRREEPLSLWEVYKRNKLMIVAGSLIAAALFGLAAIIRAL